MTFAQQSSIIDAFIALFKTLPVEIQMEIKARVFRHDKAALPIKPKISLLRGRVSKLSKEEIDKQLKTLRNEWQRGI